MKKAVYAVCGTVMVLAATALKLAAGGSWELALLTVLGLAMLVASADAQKGRV